jgi:acyl-coenzyme A synthetase/AMP-(fatty) acid ligase/thioesterase domain-containing protein/acyl carrier protein
MSRSPETVAEIWARVLGLSLPGETIHFFAEGGDSLKATEMLIELERRTGLSIPIGQIYLTPRLDDFVAAVKGIKENDRSPLIFPLKDGTTGQVLHAVAPAQGGVFHFQQLARYLPDGLGLSVIEPRVSASGRHAYSNMADLVGCCLDALRKKQPQGPYYLLGYSFGGVVAWEMAAGLEAEGQCPELLLMLDAGSRRAYPRLHGWRNLLAYLREEVRFMQTCHEVRVFHGEGNQLTELLPLALRKVNDVLNSLRPRLSASQRKGLGEGAKAMNVPAQEALYAGYRPSPFGGSMHLLRACRQLTLHRALDYDLGWGGYLRKGKPTVIPVEGDHFSFMREPEVRGIAQVLDKVIQEAVDTRKDRIENEVNLAQTLVPSPFPEPIEKECPVSRMAAIVHAFPDQVAIRDGSAQLTYAKFWENAARVSAFLARIDPSGRKGPVVLHTSTSWQFLCAIYGILRAGRTYVPVDTDFPSIRLREIQLQSEAGLALSVHPDFLSSILEGVSIYGLREALEEEVAPVPPRPLSTDAPAAILFTSGSTGRPKGTPISREHLVHLSWRRVQGWALVPSDRYIILYASPFMGGMQAMHGALMAGATLSIYNLRERGLEGLCAFLQEERVTVLHMVTSILRRFLEVWGGKPVLPDLRLLIPGGEATRASDLDLWKRTCDPKVRFGACLGSTECGGLAYNPIAMDYEHAGGPVPVGKPFSRLGVRILDAEGHELGPGEEGRITVCSRYIFRGYLNQKMSPDTLSLNEDGTVFYDTGDFGYLDGEGLLYNLGRRDSRVKVNGYLVELAEVESVAMRSGLFLEVAVVLRPLEGEDLKSKVTTPRLVAFYRTRPMAGADLPERIQAHLLEHLPKAMHPARWIELKAFPQTPNGKTNRKALSTVPI